MTKPKWLKPEELRKYLYKCKKWLSSLHVQLVLLILVGAIISTCAYIFCRSAIILFVENQYTAENAREERERSSLEELRELAREEGVTPDDLTPVTSWVENQSYVYLLIFDGDTLVYRSDEAATKGTIGLTVTYPTEDELYAFAVQNEPTAISFGEKTLNCHIAEYSEYFYYDMANLFSVVAAIIVLAFILILYFQRVTWRISRLARDVSTVSGGDMNHRIRSDEKQDEISRLCENVENMRASIVLTLEKEREAINANTDLITSMSHDIRTPLTVLLGYLDVMKMQTTDETTRQYIRASELTALRLKKLSDDMFQYFLVFSGEENDLAMQDYDGRTLLEQMLSEHVILLRENGFTVETEHAENILQDVPYIRTDAPHCMRIVDNVFSNIMKYTAKEEPILIRFEEGEAWVSVEFRNAIRADADLAESTGIGLKTCARIAKLLQCEFTTEEQDGYFTARLVLPKSTVNPSNL